MENSLVEQKIANEAYDEWLATTPGFDEIAYLEEIGYLSSSVGAVPLLIIQEAY